MELYKDDLGYAHHANSPVSIFEISCGSESEWVTVLTHQGLPQSPEWRAL